MNEIKEFAQLSVSGKQVPTFTPQRLFILSRIMVPNTGASKGSKDKHNLHGI